MPKKRRPTAEPVVAARLFVDSGAWIALFSASDRLHAEADRLFRAAIGRRVPLHTTRLNLAEVHRLLLFRGGRAAARAALDRIDASPAVVVEAVTHEHHLRALEWLDHLDDQKITYTDAIGFAVIEETGCSAVLAFDRDFAVAGFTRYQP